MATSYYKDKVQLIEWVAQYGIASKLGPLLGMDKKFLMFDLYYYAHIMIQDVTILLSIAIDTMILFEIMKTVRIPFKPFYQYWLRY